MIPLEKTDDRPRVPLMPIARIRKRGVIDTCAWAEENVYLSSRIPTSEPGPWRRQTVSALSLPGGPLEAMDDPLCETVVCMKGSQTALTTSTYTWLAKCQATDPSSALVVMNSTTDAKDKSSETWRPMWEDSPALQRFLPYCRRKEWTKLYQLINGSPVYWIGANSPGRLGSKPVRRLVLDEVDKYPKKFGAGKKKREAGAASLARQRTKAFRKRGLAKIIEFSTPTTEDGEIYLEYQNGDQRKLYVPCPECGHGHVMTWKQFKIDMALAEKDPEKAILGAHYECPACKAHWNDYDRWNAIEKGEWRPTAKPRDPKSRSYHIPSWTSTFVTHAYLAAQWIKAQHSWETLHDFINSECGEPYVAIQNRIKDAVFSELEGEYQEGELWADRKPYLEQYEGLKRAVLMGVDVQKGYMVAVARQFVEGGDSGQIWRGDCSGFKAVDKIAERFNAQFVFVDQRYRGREVQEWAATHTGYIPCYGAIRRSKTLFTANLFDVAEGKRGQGKAGMQIEVIEHDPDQLKDILAANIQRSHGARRWLVPKGTALDQEYCKQMTAERCVNGRWVNPQDKANHFWDAECLTLLAAIRMGWYGAIYDDAEEDA